ncbi:chr1, partial [Symbiodinium pilosum]
MSAIQKLVWLLVVGLVQALREKADSVIQSGSGVINSLASTHAKEVHTDEWGFKARALKKEAEKGDAQAAYDLGEMYEDGEGAKKDNREANHWYLMALRNGKKDAEVAYYRTLKIISKERASKGDWTAMYDLGDIYEHGKGGLTDLKEAAKYYQMAAEHGHERANYALGRFYEEGKGGLEKSFDKAEKYYKVAADKGMADAMNALSLLYGEGRNGVPNAYQAIEYAKKAANKGHPEAKERFYE